MPGTKRLQGFANADRATARLLQRKREEARRGKLPYLSAKHVLDAGGVYSLALKCRGPNETEWSTLRTVKGESQYAEQATIFLAEQAAAWEATIYADHQFKIVNV